MVLEEKFLKQADLPPLVVIGHEGFISPEYFIFLHLFYVGLFGFLIVLFIAFPIISTMSGSDCGQKENV
jgi:hypothetical protein